MRDQPASEAAKALTPEFKNRVSQFCQAMVHPYEHYSAAGYLIAGYWMTLRDRLRYQHGLKELVDENAGLSHIKAIDEFLSQCSDEHYLDFIEMFFQSEELPKYFSDGELREAVNNINKFFSLDELPYALTEFSISGSRTLKPRVERLLSRLRRRHKRPALPAIVSSHTQPPSLPIRIPRVEAYPQIIRVENEVTYQTAIKPVLTLLANPAFSEANREFLDALKDCRTEDYRGCVVNCGSSLESVMKIICEQNGWPPGKDAGRLLNTVLSKTDLPKFLKQPLNQIAVIRNELGNAHGAGVEPRDVAKHLVQYTINVTASAILLLVEATKP